MLQGNNLILSIDGTPLGASRTCGIDRNTDTIEKCSPVDGSARSFIPGTTSWAISAGGLYANKEGAERLRKIWRAYQRGGVVTPLAIRVTTEGVGEEGEAILTSLHEDGNKNELVKFSIQLQGSGVLEKTGTPLTLQVAQDSTAINLDGPEAVELVEDERVDYVDITASKPFVLNFKYVGAWMLLPGEHYDWIQDLDHYDEHGDMFNARVGYGREGMSATFAAGRYVLYADNGTDYVDVNIIEE